jgi:beta-xylosidase
MENNFNNPILCGADPFVLYYEGKYYMYCTTDTEDKLTGFNDFSSSSGDEDGIFVYVSNDLHSWTKHGYALKKGDVIGEKWFWAPEVLCYKGRFYMIFAAEEHMAIASADHPLGPFVQESKCWLREQKAIDGSLFVDDDGTVYLYYVQIDGGNRIFVAKMKDDLSAIETEYPNCLIEATEQWETVDSLVAEGPFVLKHNGLYYLTYSCNHTRCTEYAMGYAVSSCPTGPFIKYTGNPILKKNGKFVGVGHHSFFYAADGSLCCAYHCHSGNPDNFRPRRFCLNTAEFTSDESGIDKIIVHGPCSAE